MENKIEEVFLAFGIEGQIINYKMFHSGHINTTCLVTINKNGEEKQLVMQKINRYVFKKPEDVMENIANVTGYIYKTLKENGASTARRVLKFKPGKDKKYYIVDGEGDYWRLYKFVDKSICFDTTDDLKVLEETGKAFGEFQTLLAGFSASDLNIIIPHFHNTPNRYKIFKQILEQNPVDRVKHVKQEITEYLALEKIASKMYAMQKAGELPLRVTHNDTKCNNVLFDDVTYEHICVIDLDTVMPGLVGFDFGDAIRFAGNTCSEDETDLDKIKLDLVKFDAFTKGFMAEVGDNITEAEKDTLSLGAITMTIECGLRFLTDYIDGDNYFKISYPEHNLDRARCQLKLAQDMIEKYSNMQDIVAKYDNSKRV